MDNLIRAACRGNVVEVQRIVRQGGNINVVSTRDGDTALHGAMRNRRHDVVCELLNAGARVDLRDGKGCTALILAAQTNSPAIGRLLAAGADVHATSVHGITALHCAAIQGHVGAVRQLLTGGALVNAADRDGLTALIYAAHTGDREMAGMLLAVGADANLATRLGVTALQCAAANGNSGCLALLLQHAAIKVNSVDKLKRSALGLAVVRNERVTVQLLLDDPRVIVHDNVCAPPCHPDIVGLFRWHARRLWLRICLHVFVF